MIVHDTIFRVNPLHTVQVPRHQRLSPTHLRDAVSVFEELNQERFSSFLKTRNRAGLPEFCFRGNLLLDGADKSGEWEFWDAELCCPPQLSYFFLDSFPRLFVFSSASFFSGGGFTFS